MHDDAESLDWSPVFIILSSLEAWRQIFGLQRFKIAPSFELLLSVRYILDEQRKIYESGIWTCDLRIDVPVLYQLSLTHFDL